MAGEGGSGGNAGGTAGTGGSGGTGGNVGGSGGEGGEGGSPPCETGIYLTVDSQAGNNGMLDLGLGAGYAVSTTYLVHGTNASNKLVATITLVNNLSGDFQSASAETTSALEAVRLRCEDTSGSSNFSNVPCDLDFTDSDSVDCEIEIGDDCYNAAGNPMKLQLQVNPVAVGQAKIGFDPASIKICDVQDNPLIDVQ